MKRSHSEFDASRETTSPWIVAQLGAREHYAIPRALQNAGEQVRLVTDFWAPQSPLRWFSGRLRDRTHPGIPSEAVTAFSTSSLQFEAISRLRHLQGWPLIEARNCWFDKRAAMFLDQICRGQPNGTLFAYSYAARRTLIAARRAGWRTILGQIDPGPVEWRLVQDRRARAGLPPEPEPSSDYWDSWRRECELSDSIVVNSEWSRRALLEEAIPADRIHVVPLAYQGGVEECENANDNNAAPGIHFTPARPLRVLFLGQILVRKGVLEICDAMERLAEHPVLWTFVGGGEPRLLEQLERFPQARVLGQIGRRHAGKQYRTADIFLLPTHSDGFALTQLEAAAHGLPIIASQCCGEVVRHGVNGLLLDHVTGEAVAEAVLSMLRQPEQLAVFRKGQRRLPLPTLSGLAARLREIQQVIGTQDKETHAVR